VFSLEGLVIVIDLDHLLVSMLVTPILFRLGRRFFELTYTIEHARHLDSSQSYPASEECTTTTTEQCQEVVDWFNLFNFVVVFLVSLGL